MPKSAPRTWLLVGITAAAATPAPSQEGAEIEDLRALMLSGGATLVGLFPDDSRVLDDQTLSVDLDIERPTRNGRWLAYFEGNSSLDPQAASTIVIESNADAGTAVDADLDGRIQLSEVNFRRALSRGRYLTAGLLDPSSYLDRSRITNDENVQFLGASFVQNPTIGFPDYTLGAVYQAPASERRPEINAVLTSSHGIADNPNLSYSQLLQIAENDKGVFGAVGLGWINEQRLIRIGAWINTRPHEELSGGEATHENRGLYAVFGHAWGIHAINLRLGRADDDVSIASRFASFAYRLRLRERDAFGIGMARAWVSPEITDPLRNDSVHVEAYLRLSVTAAAHVTISAQRVRHSGFVATPDDPRESIRSKVGLLL